MRIYIQLFTKIKAFIWVTLLFNIIVSPAFGAALNIPVAKGSQGEIVILPVVVDKVDNLAGIKLVMTYEKDILKFIKAEKTSDTSKMLYVVNDKVPGKLIIVMASAKGFFGKKAKLVEMSFQLLKDVKKEDNITLQIIEAELMSENLQRIKITSY